MLSQEKRKLSLSEDKMNHISRKEVCLKRKKNWQKEKPFPHGIWKHVLCVIGEI